MLTDNNTIWEVNALMRKSVSISWLIEKELKRQDIVAKNNELNRRKQIALLRIHILTGRRS